MGSRSHPPLYHPKLAFGGGVPVVAAQYTVQRNADGTNRLQVNVPTGASFEFSINDVATLTTAATLTQVEQGNFAIASGSIQLAEIVAPGAPAANTAYIYLDDNGAGKTRLNARFPTGAVQVLATEP